MASLFRENVSEMFYIHTVDRLYLEIIWLWNFPKFGQIFLFYKCSDIGSSSSKLPAPGVHTAKLLWSPDNFYIIKQILLIWLNR